MKCVFWDSDNTLVDTAEHHWRKHFQTLQSLGITLHDKHRERIYTNNGIQNWEWISAELGLKLPQDEYLARIDSWYLDHIDEIKVRDGVMECIALFAAAKIPQAVVSNGRRNSVMAALESKNIAPKMEFILCKEDYEGRKPDPAPYLAAFKKMKETKGDINPADCLVIEDDPLGVESAHRAGMRVFHRKMHENQPAAKSADKAFFNENELISACKSFIA